MSLTEIIYNATIGAFVQYGKNAAGELKAILTDDEGRVQVDIISASIPGSTSFTSGQKTVTAAGTAEAIGGDVDCLELYVVADSENAGNIYLGGSGVDNTSGKIPPGGIMPCGPCNLSEVYIDADYSGEGISYFLVGE
ncbi:hypothetical protein M0R72_11775 [Candidatus Pacearchaeota archaeon]|jgi:hypothetical protein|nr:hypothetical protein [Candidatus Pacearchaeota archaeon]